MLSPFLAAMLPPTLVLSWLRWLLPAVAAALLLRSAARRVLRLAHMHAATADIPGPTLHTFRRLLHARRSPSRVSDVFHDVLRRHRPIFKFWSGPHLFVILMDADDIEALLTSKAVVDKAGVYRVLARLTGTGLLHLGGDAWKRRRRVVSPFLHADILKDFPEVFHRKAELMVRLLRPAARSGRAFDMQPHAGLAVNDMVCHTVMATDMHSQERAERQISEAMSDGLAIITYRVFHPWFLSDALFRLSRHHAQFRASIDVFDGFTRRLLQAKRRERVDRKNTAIATKQDVNGNVGSAVGAAVGEAGRKRPTFLDVMLDSEEGAALSEDELLNEAKTLITAASGGSTDALSFVLLCIALRQDVQDRIAQELDDVFGEDLGRVSTIDDMRHLEYLDRVIKETLRMFPSVPVFGRSIATDMTLPSGYKIPAGAQVFAYTPAVHMDPRHFPEPERFDPDRFLGERQAGRHPFSYLPFGGGPRACIGQRYAVLQLKTTVAVLLRHYRLLPAGTPRAPAAIKDIRTNLLVTQQARGGYPMRLQPRRPARASTTPNTNQIPDLDAPST